MIKKTTARRRATPSAIRWLASSWGWGATSRHSISARHSADYAHHVYNRPDPCEAKGSFGCEHLAVGIGIATTQSRGDETGALRRRATRRALGRRLCRAFFLL